MSSVITIRRSGGTRIVSLPMAVLKTLDLHTGSLLNLSLKNNSIVLTPAEKDLTLNDLLDGSPKQKLKLTEDDKAWLNTKAVGKEF